MTEGQNVILRDRSALSVSGVSEVIGFDENGVSVVTSLGDLIVKGSSLRISCLSLEEGRVDIEGAVDCVAYTKLKRKRESFLVRIFK